MFFILFIYFCSSHISRFLFSRFKCKTCDNFDFCENCFYNKNNHKHSFNRIAEPGSAAVFAGRPGRDGNFVQIYLFFGQFFTTFLQGWRAG